MSMTDDDTKNPLTLEQIRAAFDPEHAVYFDLAMARLREQAQAQVIEDLRRQIDDLVDDKMEPGSANGDAAAALDRST